MSDEPHDDRERPSQADERSTLVGGDDHGIRRARRRALARYVAAWLLGGALVAGAAVWLIERFSEDEVSLPPVHETELGDAARRAGCTLRTVDPGEVTRPPVDGTPGVAPAPSGVFEDAPSADELVAAMRAGTVVIHHHRELAGEYRDQLREIHDALPEGTIVTPAAEDMPGEIAVTAFRRILSCPAYDESTFEAVRLFQGRFVGSGPDG